MTICTSCSSRSLSASSGLDVVRPHGHGLPGADRPLPTALFKDLFLHVEHVVIELVRTAGPHGSAAVNEQLLEVPLARGHLRDAHLPRAVRIRLKAGDGLSACEDGPGAGCGLIGHAELLRAAVLRGQGQRRRHRIGPARHDDTSRLLQAGIALLLAKQIAGPLQRCHGSVGSRGIWLSEPPGPTVAAIRRHVDGHSVH